MNIIIKHTCNINTCEYDYNEVTQGSHTCQSCHLGSYVDLFSALLFQKILLCVLYYLNVKLNTSKVVSYVQRVVQTEQFILVLFKADPGILHCGMPNLTVLHYAKCSISVRVCLSEIRQHVQW